MVADIRWVRDKPHARVVTLEPDGEEQTISWYDSFELRQLADIMDGLQSPEPYPKGAEGLPPEDPLNSCELRDTCDACFSMDKHRCEKWKNAQSKSSE